MTFNFFKRKKRRKKQVTERHTKPVIPKPIKETTSKSETAPIPEPKTTRKLKPDHIPKVKAEQKSEPIDPRKEFLKSFKKLIFRHRSIDVWSDFVVMAACALSNPVDKTHYDEREKLYMRTIKKYNKQESAIFPDLFAQTVLALEKNMDQDFLGDMYMELDFGDKNRAQIFTPYCVSQLMAETTLSEVVEEVKEKGYITINDPCCGGGSTIIAAINTARKKLEKADLNFQNHVFITAQDIDSTVALMCYIQLSLLGVAGYIKIGNTLTEPMADADSTDNYWFTPMYFADVWVYRRIFKNLENVLSQ